MEMGEIELNGAHNKERLCDSLWASCGRTQAILFSKCFLVWTCWHKNIYTSWHVGFLLTGPRAHKQTQSTDLVRERERLQRWRKSWPAHRLPSGILPHTKQSGILPHTVCVTYYHTPTKPIARCTLNTKNCTLQPFHCAYYCTSHISFCTKYTSYNTHRVIFTSNSNTACCRLQPAH